MSFSRLSLLWKILLPTSAVLTIVFALTGWIVQTSVEKAATAGVEQEARASFAAYASVWEARAHLLASVSKVLSGMSDVRAAFGTGDQATIRDTAAELWSRISSEDAFFLVADAQGRLVASMGAPSPFGQREDLPMVRAARLRFPNQAAGFMQAGGRLFQVVVTPVYVESAGEPALLDVLVAGFNVDDRVARQLKGSTGGSEFVFASGGTIIASSVPPAVASPPAAGSTPTKPGRVVADGHEYLRLATPLLDMSAHPVAELVILRSFDNARQTLIDLRRDVVALWLVALAAALLVTYFVARRIMHPVAELDRAAAEIMRHNYEYKVEVRSEDELGRLARTFNAMSSSIQGAREELIRQERITTIGRLSTSIVHDLRNPLAAIYAGAEMLFDAKLATEQVQRLARNIYRASRSIQDMLQQLLNVARGRTGSAELCSLKEVVAGAWSAVAVEAESRNVEFKLELPEDLELMMERPRMERAFLNLLQNAVQAMPTGGNVTVRSEIRAGEVLVSVTDTGPGIRPELRSRLFQPFVTGRKNGLGLGLALSRQTIWDHGGDIWVDFDGPGARFWLRIPLSQPVRSTLEHR